MKVRIGIDAGGTFTDAAVIDNDTCELTGSREVPIMSWGKKDEG
jgi:N-methylhydantoinase A/oxoprolinase/acetone carboxylase beta subunit